MLGCMRHGESTPREKLKVMVRGVPALYALIPEHKDEASLQNSYELAKVLEILSNQKEGDGFGEVPSLSLILEDIMTYKN